MDQNYRWYRQDELTRKSIITNAVFATQNGFKTTQDPPTPDIKTEIDRINKQVNLDKTLYTAQINRSIHGKAAHDIMNLNVDDASRDLARMENKQISETAEACTEKVSGTAYSDWGAMTTPPDSDTNPFTAIQASIEYIEAKGYTPDFMALHPSLWGKFVTNSYVKDLVHAGIATLNKDGGQFTLPGYPTIRVITDNHLTQTPTASLGPLIGDSKAPALVLGEGPTEAAQYRNEKAGYNAYIIRQYLEPKLVIDNAMDKICT